MESACRVSSCCSCMTRNEIWINFGYRTVITMVTDGRRRASCRDMGVSPASVTTSFHRAAHDVSDDVILTGTFDNIDLSRLKCILSATDLSRAKWISCTTCLVTYKPEINEMDDTDREVERLLTGESNIDLPISQPVLTRPSAPLPIPGADYIAKNMNEVLTDSGKTPYYRSCQRLHVDYNACTEKRLKMHEHSCNLVVSRSVGTQTLNPNAT